MHMVLITLDLRQSYKKSLRPPVGDKCMPQCGSFLRTALDSEDEISERDPVHLFITSHTFLS